jgi:hypothetical protein
VWWDLHLDLTTEAKTRTPPLYSPPTPVGPDGRSAPEGVRLGILAPPGTYTVKLATGGQVATQKLELLKDPNSGGSEEEIRVQTALMQEIRADLEDVAGMINRIESARAQLVALRNTLAADSTMKGLRADADSLEKKFTGVEEDLAQLMLTGRGQDDVRYPMKLLGRLGWLADGVGGSDFAPTTQQREVQQLLRQQTRSAHSRLDAVIQTDLTAFNQKVRARGVDGIVVKTP